MDVPLMAHDLEMLRQFLLQIDIHQERIATDPHPDTVEEGCQLIHELSFTARALVDKLLGTLGLTDGAGRLSDIDRARAGLPVND